MATFGFDQAIDTIADGLQDLAGALGFDVASNPEGAIYAKAQQAFNEGLAWEFKGSDWYKVFGYQFVVLDSAGTPPQELIYTLPIPPQSINVRMIPASQATPTIGGVVEETNANVFWLINLAGTTGIAVSRQGNGADKRHKMAKQFRDTIGTTGLLSGALAGINTAISQVGGTIDGVVNSAQAIASGNVAGGVSGLVGSFNNLFLPGLPYSGSAVDSDTNGYTEIQEFHRFLYTYSKLKGKFPDRFRLFFRSYKTNQQWQCIVQDFTIQQSANDPMLYRYNIALKAWDVRSAKTTEDLDDEAFDRFGPEGDLQSVNLINPQLFSTISANVLNGGSPF